MNRDKHVWEGWTVGAFIDELEPSFNLIQRGGSWQKPFKTREAVERWTAEEQPYYKKPIKEVVDYFAAKI